MKDSYIPVRVLNDFVSGLGELGIDYMLTGSMAMIRYTVFRQTADIDVVLNVVPADAERLIKKFAHDYYVPVNAVRESIDSGGMFNLIQQDTAFKIDCIVKKESKFQDAAFGRREKTDYYGDEIWIISKEDLILSKLQWAKETGSEMQSRDIANLLRSGFDKCYVESWITKLGVEYLYNEISGNLKNEGHDQGN